MSENHSDDDQDIGDLAREHLRAVEDAEATREQFLAEWAERFYEPGYLDDEEWALLKELVEDGDTDAAGTILELAAYRKAATETGRAEEFDDEWPAKTGGER